MNLKTFFDWFYKRLFSYNIFIPEENDYDDDDDDDDDNQIKDARIILKQQKFSTWLYLFLLTISCYLLFYSALIKPQSRTYKISSIDLDIFKDLSLQYPETLSCPCTKITIPYEDFLTNQTTFHPICSSLFITEQWINALYFPNASMYGVPDFRTTAHSQFELLSSLCLFSQKTINENQIELNHNELITFNLLDHERIQLEINATVELFENSITNRISSFINYLRISIRSNYLVSSLNTNLVILSGISNGNVYPFSSQTMYRRYWLGSMLDETSLPCSSANPISPAGFFSVSLNIVFFSHLYWYEPEPNSTLVRGFYAGCTPFEALLQSTLDCLYDIQCLHLLSNYFPNLNQQMNLSNYVLQSNKKNLNITINDLLLKLFIEKQKITINYSKYFQQCSPFYCTYTITKQSDLSYTITLFISLYGGLIFIFRFISPFLIQIYFKWKFRLQNPLKFNFLESIKQLNLFKNINDRTEQSIKQQKLITRVYLILLIISILILILFHSLNTEMTTRIISNPSLSIYNQTQMLHSDTISCRCSNTAISYRKFLTLSPVFHQICLSDFVNDRWITILKQSVTFSVSYDWRNGASSQFQLLSDLCRLANKTVNDAIDRLLSQSFITLNVLTKVELEKEIDAYLNEFNHSIIISFNLLAETINMFLQVDQPYMGTVQDYFNYDNTNLIGNIVIDPMTNESIAKFSFILYGFTDINSTFSNCICATKSDCQSSVAIYNIDSIYVGPITDKVIYIVPGSYISCSPLESLQLSTLECFYSHSTCFVVLTNYTKELYIQNIENASWFNIQPLVYNSTLSHFPPNISISEILEEVMIEKWNSSVLYKDYYESCAPSDCSYLEKINTKTSFGILLTLISMTGGLTVSLRLITPHLVVFIINLLTKKDKRQQQQQDHLNLYNRLKTILHKLITSLSQMIIQLNIFPLRKFGNNIDRNTAKHLGQWSTRLYIVLFLIAIVIFTLYSLIQPVTITETFPKPSFQFYNELKEKYGDDLKCSCSSIAFTYDRFINITPVFHQICSSQFISNEWRQNLTKGLVSNLSIYEQRDYRRFLSSHLQFLQQICHLSIQSVNSSTEQLLSSLIITKQLLSNDTFHNRLSSIVDQTISNAPITFTRLLFLIQNINHGNSIISSYGTNFEYIVPWYNRTIAFAITQAIIYDKNCSCGLSSTCTTQANFIEINPLKTTPIEGLKMGCLPSESFLLSTLECFYNQTCLNLIQFYTNYQQQIIPLQFISNRSLIHSTINELIKNSFVDEWNKTMNYELYFQQCLPSSCFYTYIKQFNLLYTITLLLSLQGGLTIVLKWICPLIVWIVVKIYQQHQRKRRDRVQPIRSLEITSIETSNTTDRGPTIEIESTHHISTTERNEVTLSFRCSFKIIFICVLLVFTIVILILFSIYSVRQNEDEIISTDE